MPDFTINDLSARTSLAADDVFEVDNTSSADDSEKATFALMGGLEIVHRDADSTHTFVVGEHYYVDLNGTPHTASRTWTLPTTHAVGERCAITIEGGDASFHIAVHTGTGNTCIFKGETISASSEITRLFITGDTLVFKSVTANSIWQLEHDGRVPQRAYGYLNTLVSGHYTDNTLVRVPLDTEDHDIGDILDVSTTVDKITVRRAGTYQVACQMAVKDPVDGTETLCRIVDGAGTIHIAGTRAGAGVGGLQGWAFVAGPITVTIAELGGNRAIFQGNARQIDPGTTNLDAPGDSNGGSNYLACVEIL